MIDNSLFIWPTIKWQRRIKITTSHYYADKSKQPKSIGIYRIIVNLLYCKIIALKRENKKNNVFSVDYKKKKQTNKCSRTTFIYLPTVPWFSAIKSSCQPGDQTSPLIVS